MSRQWNAAYAESLANAPSGRKALDAQGLHHSGFDVARGKSGVGKNQKLDLERHPDKAAGLYFSQALIWVKEHPVLTRKDFMTNHELAFYGWKEGAAHRFFGPPNVPDVGR